MVGSIRTQRLTELRIVPGHSLPAEFVTYAEHWLAVVELTIIEESGDSWQFPVKVIAANCFDLMTIILERWPMIVVDLCDEQG